MSEPGVPSCLASDQAELPSPPNRLGLAKDDLLTAIDGATIFSPADLKSAIEAKLKAKITDLTIEFVTPKGEARVIRYQIHPTR